jgi:hypothetical protein
VTASAIRRILTISGHAGLAGDASRDEDDVSTLQTLAEAGRSWIVALDSRLGVDVADVGGDTCLISVHWSTSFCLH